ncbi:MAG: hypothetical protein NE327_17205 [Lentisphaeraceae bacterium]|nr:hypothetical protein [Lentisphaeraceae bacterium]
MKYAIILLFLSLFSYAEENYGQLILQDDFERNESDESKEEPGNDWVSNSKSRAKGNKQLDLRDGALYIYTHAEADHAAVAKHKIGFHNGTISLKFKFESSKDSMNINIADSKEKSVHAGHLFNVTVSPSKVALTDLKTGNMKLEHREARKSKKVSPELKKLLSTKTKSFKHKLELNQWHTLTATVKGDEISCSVNGKHAGTFKAEGFAHPVKQEIRLIVNKNVYVDEIRVWKEN